MDLALAQTGEADRAMELGQATQSCQGCREKQETAPAQDRFGQFEPFDCPNKKQKRGANSNQFKFTDLRRHSKTNVAKYLLAASQARRANEKESLAPATHHCTCESVVKTCAPSELRTERCIKVCCVAHGESFRMHLVLAQTGIAWPRMADEKVKSGQWSKTGQKQTADVFDHLLFSYIITNVRSPKAVLGGMVTP